MSVKEQVLAVVRALPEGATVADAIAAVFELWMSEHGVEIPGWRSLSTDQMCRIVREFPGGRDE